MKPAPAIERARSIKQTSITILACLTISISAHAGTAANIESNSTQTQPNILLLVAEDLSPRIASFGDPVAKTPNIDALAAVGTRYTNAFTTAGVCAPSRAALITGQHQISFGAQHMRTSTGPLGKYFARPPAEVRAFPELLRRKGYFTYTDRKLDYQFSGIYAGTGPFTIWDREGAEDVAWRQRADGQPFFALINFLETHESGVMRPQGKSNSAAHKATQDMRKAAGLVAARITPPEAVTLPPYYPDLPAVRADLARHYDNIHAMDTRVGKIMDALATDGLLDNTIVIWTTDHGDGLPRAKRTLYDSGLHVPLIVSIPKTLDKRQSQSGQTPLEEDTRLISFIDLAPTILSLAQIPPPTYLHGQSVFAEPRRKYVYAARDRIDEVVDRQRAIRDKRFKYIRSWHPDIPDGHKLAYRDNLDMVRDWRAAYLTESLDPTHARWFQAVGEEQLYDTTSDPHETNNLAADIAHQATLQRLRGALDKFLNAVGDTSHHAEAHMRETLLDEGLIPTTPAPWMTIEAGTMTLHSPIGASIGYRYADETHWRLYHKPIRYQPISFKSVRYGWQESTLIEVP